MLSAQRTNVAIFALCLLAPWTLLWLDSGLLFPYETGKAWVFRGVVELAFGLFAYQQVLSPGFKKFADDRARLLLALLAIFLLWNLLTALTGIDAYRSIWSNYERMAGWIAYLHWAMYLLCLMTVLNSERVILVLGNLILVLTIVCLLGLFETEKRIISTLGNPIYLGNLAVLGTFLLGFSVVERLRTSNKNKLLIVLMSLIIILITGLALIKTASRGPFLALGVALLSMALVILFGRLGKTSFRANIWVFLGLLLLGIGLSSQLGTVQNLIKQSDNYALQRIGRISMQDQTTADRLENWRIAMDAVKQHPVLGWGNENYAIAFTEHYRAGVMDNADIWFDRAHNAYLDVMVASGILGLVLYCLILGLPILLVLRISSWSVWQKAFAIGFFIAFGVKNLVGMDTFSSTLLWLSFVAVILSQTRSSAASANLVGMNMDKAWLIVPILAFSLASVYWLNIKPYQANRHLARGMDTPEFLGQDAFNGWLLESQNTQRIGVNARLAVYDKLLVPTQGQALEEAASNNHALLFQQAGELISTELEHQPRNYRIRYNGSLLLARLGHYDLAIKLLKDLTQSAPQRTVFWHSLAQVHAAAGDETSAAKVRAIIQQLNPNWRP